jgi:hypothetical protein
VRAVHFSCSILAICKQIINLTNFVINHKYDSFKGTPLRYGRMSQKKVKFHEPIIFCYLRVRDIQTESVIH